MALSGLQLPAACDAAPPLQEGDAWAALEGKIAVFAGQHQAARRLLESMAREQDAFLTEVRELVRAQRGEQCGGATPGAAREEEPGFTLGSSSGLASKGWQGASSELTAPEDAPHLHDKSPMTTASFDNDALATTEPLACLSRQATQTQSRLMQQQSYVDEVFFDHAQTLCHSTRPTPTSTSFMTGRGSFSAAHSSALMQVRLVAKRVLTSRFFEPTMGVIILLNAANIGWTIDRELQGQDTSAQEFIEDFLLGIFICELFLRFFVFGCRCLKRPWDVFDSVIISLTLASMAIKELIYSATSDPGVFLQVTQQMLLLRMLRLLRLARAVRLVAMCRSLWKLVQGLRQCLTTMVSAFAIMILFIFFFACFGAEFITKVFRDDPHVGQIVREKFSSMPKIVLTLFQFISLDSVAGFYVPLINRSPALSIYFGLLLVLVSIALMNLVTALLVEDAISSTKMDNEMLAHFTRSRLCKLRPAFVRLFQSLDKSGDGLVNVKEVVEAIKDGLHVEAEIQDIINPARMLDLFDAIDQDRSGDLTEAEFVEGLGCVALSDVPLETMQILHHLRILRRELSSCKREIKQRKVISFSESERARPTVTTPAPSSPPSEGLAQPDPLTEESPDSPRMLLRM